MIWKTMAEKGIDVPGIVTSPDDPSLADVTVPAKPDGFETVLVTFPSVGRFGWLPITRLDVLEEEMGR